MKSLKPAKGDLKYTHIIGTGGIGSGMFFRLKGNHTLGRNESRMGSLLPRKDFCKQHIILHYISVLLGAKAGTFHTFPIGKVGNDRIGKDLVEMMEDVGINTKHVSICEDSNTLFSVCYQYPDHSGGNITTENSACSKVSPNDISQFFHREKPEATKEIILAAPEVPLEARIKLLQFGRQRKSLNIASVLSSEIDEFKKMGGFEMVDILSINMDEAKSIAGIVDDETATKTIVDACIKTLENINPSMSVLITDGAHGSYCYREKYLEFTPPLKVHVSSTAGAGDAFLAGTISGLCLGLNLIKGVSDPFFSKAPVNSAVELATLLASLSVTSQDTIHLAANAELLYNFAIENDIRFTEEFLKIFQDFIQ